MRHKSRYYLQVFAKLTQLYQGRERAQRLHTYRRIIVVKWDKGWIPISLSVNLTIYAKGREEWSTVNWWLCHAINTFEWLALSACNFPWWRSFDLVLQWPMSIESAYKIRGKGVLCKYTYISASIVPHCLLIIASVTRSISAHRSRDPFLE